MPGTKFNPAEMEKLLDTARSEWNDPVRILSYLNLGECTMLAEVGCGPGWFTVEAARRMHGKGLVYAVDVSQEMLDRLKARADQAGLDNVHTVLAEEADEWPVPTESVDAVLLANVYHEVDPATNFLGELKRIMKPMSICLVVEWKVEPTPVGPPMEHRVDQQDMTEEFYSNGFILAGTCDVGPYHYGLKFYKPRGGDEGLETMNNVVP